MFEDNTLNQDGYPFSAGEVERDARLHRNKKKPEHRVSILVLAVCILLSGALGFAGGYLCDQIIQSRMAIDVIQETAQQTASLSETLTPTGAKNTPESPNALPVVEVAAAVKQAVVEITTETVTTSGRMGQLIREGAGSGIIVSADGHIVTNNHVVSGARNIIVRLADGMEYSAGLIGADAKTDLAVIKIEAAELTPTVLGDSSTLMVGETVVAVGNPLGALGGTVTSGILSALDRAITIDGKSMRLLQTDAAINPGNSGGGLFNLYGELIGIVNAKSSGADVEGLGFAIPINTVKFVIESIIENGYVQGRVDVGLTLIEITDAHTAAAYRVNKTGLYIYSSTNNNFRSGDRIVAINGVEINSLSEYNAVIDSYQVGDTVNITVSRRGQALTVEILLTELHG